MTEAQPQTPEEKRAAGLVRKRERQAKYRAENPEKLRAYRAVYAVENHEKLRAYNKRYSLENRKALLVAKARYRAKKSGLEFSIAVDTIRWPTHCPVLGIELDYTVTGSRGCHQPNSPSLDRWNNNIGYTPHNTVVISDRANRLKRDGTLEELERVVYYARYGKFLPPRGCEDFW